MKKFLSLLMAMTFIFIALAAGVAALGAPAISVSDASGAAGNTIQVAVNIADNPGIVSLKFSIAYDSSKLKLTNAADCGLIGTNTAFFGNDITVNPYTLMWEDGIATENHTANGTVVTLTFEILSTASAGDTSVIIALDQGSTFNVSLDDVAFKMEDGKVTITENDPEPPSYTDATIAVGDSVTGEENTVSVPIVMYNNPGIIALSLSVNYDTEKLTLTRVVDGGLFGSSAATFGNDLSQSPYNLIWEDGLSQTDYTANGTLATLTFSVNPSAIGDTEIVLMLNSGSTFNIDLENVTFDTLSKNLSIAAPKVKIHTWNPDIWEGEEVSVSYSVGDTFVIPENPQIVEDFDNAVPWVDIVNGGLYDPGNTYTITGEAEFYLLGDVSGDGSLDSYDISLLQRFINEIVTVEDVLNGSTHMVWQVGNVKNYDAEFELTNDMNEDWYDYYDSADISVLNRYVNGYNVTMGY